MLWKVALGVGAAFVLVVAGVVIGIRLALPPIDLNSSDPWVRVKVFSGDLNPQDRDVTVTVSVVSHRSDGLDQRDAFRTKIEIASAGGVRTFLWSQDYAGSWCEIVDLDRDGYREFVLVDSRGLAAAVVLHYRDGEYTFRRSLDSLISVEGALEFRDIDGRGTMALITFAAEEQGRLRPIVQMWSRDRGFYEAPPEVQEAYRKRVAQRRDQE